MKCICFVAIAACVSFAPRANAQTSAPAAEKPSIAGGWTLNKELSDQDPRRGGRSGDDRGGGGGRGGYGRRGGGGGFCGRGVGRGPAGGATGAGGRGPGQRMNAAAVAR